MLLAVRKRLDFGHPADVAARVQNLGAPAGDVARMGFEKLEWVRRREEVMLWDGRLSDTQGYTSSLPRVSQVYF